MKPTFEVIVHEDPLPPNAFKFVQKVHGLLFDSTDAITWSCLELRFLVWVRHFDLANLEPHDTLLLGRGMFHPDLLHLGLFILSNERGVPELRSNAQVLAATHQGVGLAAFHG